MKNRTLSLLLVVILLFTTACSTTSTESSIESTTKLEQSEVMSAPTSATKIVTDHAGNQVEIPTEINRIVITGLLPLPSVYCLFEGNADKLVGMPPSAMAAAENSILAEYMPDILNVDTSFVQNNEINIEELLKLNPDVIFYSATNSAEYEKIKDSGIPAVGFSTVAWDYNSIETFEGWVTLLGEVLGQENKAADIVAYGKETEQEIINVISSAENLEKPRALVLYSYSNGTIKVAGNDFFSEYWLETTGAENVAAEISGQAEVNIEQIYAWDPDIIYITNFTPYMPEDLYNNTISGEDWSSIKAVREEKVYKFPLGMYRWFPPSSDVPLALKWIAQKNHPELFEDMDMAQEVRDYYKEFYNYELTDEQVEKIFNPSPEASGVAK